MKTTARLDTLNRICPKKQVTEIKEGKALLKEMQDKDNSIRFEDVLGWKSDKSLFKGGVKKHINCTQWNAKGTTARNELERQAGYGYKGRANLSQGLAVVKGYH